MGSTAAVGAVAGCIARNFAVGDDGRRPRARPLEATAWPPNLGSRVAVAASSLLQLREVTEN